jgi:hypothetical protein
MNFELVKKAAAYVRELGAEDNKEHLVALDVYGNALFVVHGEEHQVSFEGYDISNVAYVVHNHPNGSALSAQDIGMASVQGVTVVCVTPNGSLFASKGINSDVVRQRYGLYGVSDEDVKVGVANQLVGKERDIGMSLVFGRMTGQFNEDPDTYASHFANKIFQAQGFLDYEYEMSPRDKMKFAAYQGFFEKKSGLKVSLT